MNVKTLILAMRQQTEVRLPLVGSEHQKNPKIFKGIPYNLSFDRGNRWFVSLAGKSSNNLRCIFVEKK